MDIKDSFLEEYREKLEKDCPEGEDSFEYAEKHLHDLLCKMTLDELNRLMKNPWVKGLGGDGEYAYVIPFVFVEYECFDLPEDVRAALKSMLSLSLRGYSRSATSLLGKRIGSSDRRYFVYVLQVFNACFDEIITGKKTLEGDKGLLASMIGSELTLVNVSGPKKPAAKKKAKAQTAVDGSAGRCAGLRFSVAGLIKWHVEPVHTFNNQKDFVDYVKAQGGSFSASVTSNTDYLVNTHVFQFGNAAAAEERIQSAEALGVPIISLSEFVEKFGKPDPEAEKAKKAEKAEEKEPAKQTEPVGDSCKDLIFVITGNVYHFENRKEFTEYVKSQGGHVASAVTEKTDYLVNNDPFSPSMKNMTAQRFGTKTITEKEFIEKFGGPAR